MDILIIEVLYPKVYESAKKYHTFENKVYQHIDDTYGINTLDNILKFNEFNNEIDNVKKNILKDTQMNRLAQKYNKYFNEYIKETYELKLIIGYKDTIDIMNILKMYFKNLI